MATLVLRSAGAALGTALGGPVGGLVGGALGAVGGAVVDNLLANALTSRRNRAPQLDAVAITHAEEGAPVRKLWGRMRVGGNVIWCTQFQAVTTNQKSTSASGKGLGSSTKVTSFELSFAVAFCEGGDDVSLGRVWADGNELDLGQYGYHFYSGSESQVPDDWIESVEGTGAVPAYRGTCYLVFNLMPLADFGDRMPQITAEIVRRPPIPDADDVTNTLQAVCLLPGAGEFVLGTQVYQSSDGFGSWFPENVHTPNGIPDFLSSLYDLERTLPNHSAVSLVVAWFGTDLRAGTCQIVPKVETATKTVRPVDWAVAGVTRATAQLVSQVSAAALDPTGLSELAPATGTVPAFGGTPSDDTVIQAIQAMNGQNIRVQFYPFVMMDVAARQRPARPLRRHRAGRLSVARPRHLLPRPRAGRHRRQDLRGGRPGERLLRCLCADGAPLCFALRGGRRRRQLRDRLRARGADAAPLRARRRALSGRRGAEELWPRR